MTKTETESVKAWMVVECDGTPYELCLTEGGAKAHVVMSRNQYRVIPVRIVPEVE